MPITQDHLASPTPDLPLHSGRDENKAAYEGDGDTLIEIDTAYTKVLQRASGLKSNGGAETPTPRPCFDYESRLINHKNVDRMTAAASSFYQLNKLPFQENVVQGRLGNITDDSEVVNSSQF